MREEQRWAVRAAADMLLRGRGHVHVASHGFPSPCDQWQCAFCVQHSRQWDMRDVCGRSGDGGPYLGGNKGHESPMGGVCPGTVEML